MMSSGFLWIILACALYGIIHSILASNQVKSLAARAVGQRFYQRFYRLFFVAVGTITALPLLALAAWLPDQVIYSIPDPWRYLTLLIQLVGVIGLLAAVAQTGALRFIGLQQVFAAPPAGAASEPDTLVVSGLYHWVRHPIYTASFMILWFNPVMTWNALALIIGLSAYMLIGSIFEEHKLVEQFGSAYETYRRQTPRIIPGLKFH